MIDKNIALKKEYLFLSPDSNAVFSEDIFIITANNEDEATYIAATVGIKDDYFNEYAHDRSINMSFAETFIYDRNEIITLFSEEDGSQLVSDDEFLREFTRRVKLFFKNNNKLSKEYISYFFSEEDDFSLSKELLINIWTRKWMDYKIIEIKNINKY